MDKFMITEEHGQRFPTVRLSRVVLQNLKSVTYGEITIGSKGNGRKGCMNSDILGIYGQNGSGKTTFIEALSILRHLMTGSAIPHKYADCISISENQATLTFYFDLFYPDGTNREVVYCTTLTKEARSEDDLDETKEMFKVDEDDVNCKVVVSAEKVSMSWDEDGVRRNLQTIIDTSSEDEVFTPITKRRILAGTERHTMIDLEVCKSLAQQRSQSFIFLHNTLSIFKSTGGDSIFLQVLLELRYYAHRYLFVVDPRSSGLIRLNLALPVYTTKGILMMNINSTTPIPESVLPKVKEQLDAISTVLTQLVPGLTIDVRQIGKTLDKKGQPMEKAALIACRNGKELLLRDESDGVRKIISVLSLIIAAFNQESVTVAVDEFDAGIFEYLLGEILQAMEESGKGQFIFTSHNLRPLEVINKKFLYFTTTNPENRYIKLKNIGSCNNLRDVYFRELVIGEQDEQIYQNTKRFKIVSALRKAGVQK
jgi:AAA15 family ATPase/GTPase